MMSRLVLALYVTSLVLLPWTWFPPFPWLHEHAQWSDLIFGVTALFWAIDRWRSGFNKFRTKHLTPALYFFCACLSLYFASPNPLHELPKLFGIAELCVLAVITADLAARPDTFAWIPKSISITALLTGAAAIAGLLLFYAGMHTSLVGIYGELEQSRWYARVQAGTYNPNLLASFCIFAAAVVSQRGSNLPNWLRRCAMIILWVTVFLTFSRGILGFILAALIRAATTPRRKAIAATAGVSLVVVMIALTVWKPLINPARPLETRFQVSQSSRYHSALASLNTLVNSPIFGSGLGTHPGEYRGEPFDSHLTPLNVAATLGLPALVVMSFLMSLAWSGRDKPTDLAIWGGLAGLALDGLAQDIEDFRHVWVILGLALAGTNGAVNAKKSLTEREPAAADSD